MNQLEHKIAEAFTQKDKATEYKGSDTLWNKIAMAQPGTTTAFLLWKVAAIFLGVLLTGSLIAGFSIQKRTTQKLNAQFEQNQMLILKMDSLLKLSPKVITKTEYIESTSVSGNEKKWQQKIESLTQNNSQLSRENLFLNNKLKERENVWFAERDSLKTLLAKNNKSKEQILEQPKKENLTKQENFEIIQSENKPSTEKIDAVNQPKLQLMLYSNTMNNKKIESGSTLFTK